MKDSRTHVVLKVHSETRIPKLGALVTCQIQARSIMQVARVYFTLHNFCAFRSCETRVSAAEVRLR